jgi:hypothetical protein
MSLPVTPWIYQEHDEYHTEFHVLTSSVSAMATNKQRMNKYSVWLPDFFVLQQIEGTIAINSTT